VQPTKNLNISDVKSQERAQVSQNSKKHHKKATSMVLMERNVLEELNRPTIPHLDIDSINEASFPVSSKESTPTATQKQPPAPRSSASKKNQTFHHKKSLTSRQTYNINESNADISSSDIDKLMTYTVTLYNSFIEVVQLFEKREHFTKMSLIPSHYSDSNKLATLIQSLGKIHKGFFVQGYFKSFMSVHSQWISQSIQAMNLFRGLTAKIELLLSEESVKLSHLCNLLGNLSAIPQLNSLHSSLIAKTNSIPQALGWE